VLGGEVRRRVRIFESTGQQRRAGVPRPQIFGTLSESPIHAAANRLGERHVVGSGPGAKPAGLFLGELDLGSDHVPKCKHMMM